MPASSSARADGARRLFAALFQAHAVEGLAGGAVAGDLAVDVRAARLRLLHFFEDEEPGAFGDHEAVAIAGERAARRARGSSFQLVVMMRISWKPRRISGAMGESTPPVTMVSSTPA